VRHTGLHPFGKRRAAMQIAREDCTGEREAGVVASPIPPNECDLNIDCLGELGPMPAHTI
jgi:hypothetical protein